MIVRLLFLLVLMFALGSCHSSRIPQLSGEPFKIKSFDEHENVSNPLFQIKELIKQDSLIFNCGNHKKVILAEDYKISYAILNQDGVKDCIIERAFLREKEYEDQLEQMILLEAYYEFSLLKF